MSASNSRTDPSNGDTDDDLGLSQPHAAPKTWMRFAGLGIELASYTLALAAIGYAVDTSRGHAKPICTALGTLIGFSFGMFRFIQRVSNGKN